MKTPTEDAARGTGRRDLSGSQIEQSVDELMLLANISAADPTRLPLPDHVQRFVSRNRSLSCEELAKALLGLHTSLDRPMSLLQEVAQILDRSMAAAAAQGSFRFHPGNRRALETGLIGIDDAGLGYAGSRRVLRNRRLAAAASRNTGSRKSIVASMESLAR